MALSLVAAIVLGLSAELKHVIDISWPALLFQATAPGIGEELLWRGLIQTGLNNSIKSHLRIGKIDIGAGTVITALCFGLAHLPNSGGQSSELTILQVVSAVAGALVLGIGYERTRNLWGAMIVHNLANLALMVMAARLVS